MGLCTRILWIHRTREWHKGYCKHSVSLEHRIILFSRYKCNTREIRESISRYFKNFDIQQFRKRDSSLFGILPASFHARSTIRGSCGVSLSPPTTIGTTIPDICQKISALEGEKRKLWINSESTTSRVVDLWWIKLVFESNVYDVLISNWENLNPLKTSWSET